MAQETATECGYVSDELLEVVKANDDERTDLSSQDELDAALARAVILTNTGTVEILLALGADPNIRNACYNELHKAYLLLQKEPAKRKKAERYKAVESRPLVIEALTFYNFFGEYEVQGNCEPCVGFEIVKLLLKYGAKANPRKPTEGYCLCSDASLLHAAVNHLSYAHWLNESQLVTCLKFLIDIGVDINSGPPSAISVLEQLVETPRNHRPREVSSSLPLTTIQFLVANGADSNIIDKPWNTEAHQRGDSRLIDYCHSVDYSVMRPRQLLLLLDADLSEQKNTEQETKQDGETP